jgi:hypothetical protein
MTVKSQQRRIAKHYKATLKDVKKITVARRLRNTPYEVGDDVTKEALKWPNLRSLVRQGYLNTEPPLNYRKIPRQQSLHTMQRLRQDSSARRRNLLARARDAGIEAKKEAMEKFKKELHLAHQKVDRTEDEMHGAKVAVYRMRHRAKREPKKFKKLQEANIKAIKAHAAAKEELQELLLKIGTIQQEAYDAYLLEHEEEAMADPKPESDGDGDGDGDAPEGGDEGDEDAPDGDEGGDGDGDGDGDEGDDETVGLTSLSASDTVDTIKAVLTANDVKFPSGARKDDLLELAAKAVAEAEPSE